MLHQRVDPKSATPAPMPAGIAPARRHRGRRNWQSGAAAEDAVARHYLAAGAVMRARRLRTPGGELDLVLEDRGQLVFVEVKRDAAGSDAPVSRRQWRRLENAALHYMVRVQNETGVQPVCRFDVALAGPDGRLRIIENARSFEAD